MNAINKISDTDRYARCVETSKRVRWDIDKDIRGSLAMFRTILRSGFMASTILAAGFAYAHDHTASNTLARSNTHAAAQQGTTPHVAAPPGEADVPLWEGLGSHSYEITTSNPLAQRYFDQGLALAYGFNHWEARRAFLAAQKADPNCAMCFWGEALVLGPNINWPMQPEAVEPALAATAEAKRLAPQASEREQALINALTARYSADSAAERPPLDRAYADAMREVVSRFPDDLDIATLYAEALMDLSPWVYWTEGGTTPKEGLEELVPTLERVLRSRSGPYRRDPPLHPCRGSIRPAGACGTPRRPACSHAAVRRPPRAYAFTHLFPARALRRLRWRRTRPPSPPTRPIWRK